MSTSDDAMFHLLEGARHLIEANEALRVRLRATEDLLYEVWRAANDHMATVHPDDEAGLGLSADHNRSLDALITSIHGRRAT
jgi:hypothetical protein